MSLHWIGIPTNGVDPTYKAVSTIGGYHTRAIYCVDWSHASGLIVSAGGDDSICLYRESLPSGLASDVPSFELVTRVQAAHGQVAKRWSFFLVGLTESMSLIL